MLAVYEVSGLFFYTELGAISGEIEIQMMTVRIANTTSRC